MFASNQDLWMFVGDIHGKTNLIPNPHHFPDFKVCLLGDLGIGFPGVHIPDHERLLFIRGNHDSPDAARRHPGYIGDWKVIGDKLFVSGARSVDSSVRTEGVDWWRDEELSMKQLSDMIDAAERSTKKFRIKTVVSHCAPFSVLERLGLLAKGQAERERTSVALDYVLRILRPELMVFGHYHRSTNETIDGTRFVCLDEGEQYYVH